MDPAQAAAAQAAAAAMNGAPPGAQPGGGGGGPGGIDPALAQVMWDMINNQVAAAFAAQPPPAPAAAALPQAKTPVPPLFNGHRDKEDQTGSVRSYVTAIRNTALLIPGIQDAEIKDRFIRGLKQRTQQDVRMRAPATFEAAVEMAERFDALMYDRYRQSKPFGQTPGPQPMELGAVMHNRHNPASGNRWDRQQPSSFSPGNRRQPDRPKLTPELRQQLLREGKCFYCRKTGHMALQCPERRQQGNPARR
ncbi:hypothetical protein CHLNCDRAFT_133051 [Chlorella variabilis]|uniref:CCHC-type domain-containing protein n=1 Tax=Chlorella variabilis TaxID=554065 RepID=E1Z288_CHLVA|nr:hypothetical protein CHLNCDRAFT_133051 [Chlorella variabilis]EFN59617.1 hypothetical protein CHLNCDRAFT_133051 [Chlorella variabilis]|eukprot:XP_005851719.1 hypothetical protein CHLNCDRAFT_133051 [Chlorella variabilis]